VSHTESKRRFTTAPNHRIKDFFPEPDTPNIRTTKPAWRHPSTQWGS